MVRTGLFDSHQWHLTKRSNFAPFLIFLWTKLLKSNTMRIVWGVVASGLLIVISLDIHLSGKYKS